MLSWIIWGILLVITCGWYEWATSQVCEKRKGEILKDGIVMLLFFLGIFWALGHFFLSIFSQLEKVGFKIPEYTYFLFSGFLYVASFRSACELIRISKRDGTEDSGLAMIKIGFEMVLWFLIFPVSAIWFATTYGIRWWNFETILKPAIAGIMGWLVVWFNLPGTYRKFQETGKLIVLIAIFLHLLTGYQCSKALSQGWNPRKVSYFAWKSEKKIKKIAMIKPKPVEIRSVVVPKLELGMRPVRVKVVPREKIRLIFRPNPQWIWDEKSGYEVFLWNHRQRIKILEIKEVKKTYIWNFKNPYSHAVILSIYSRNFILD